VEFAFSMDREAFYDHQGRTQRVNMRFDCGRTHWELESAGIETPIVTGDLLRAYVEGLLYRDADCRQMMRSGMEPLIVRSRAEA
jgi:hypothetical protein